MHGIGWKREFPATRIETAASTARTRAGHSANALGTASPGTLRGHASRAQRYALGSHQANGLHEIVRAVLHPLGSSGEAVPGKRSAGVPGKRSGAVPGEAVPSALALLCKDPDP
jgi:hypothetical protein